MASTGDIHDRSLTGDGSHQDSEVRRSSSIKVPPLIPWMNQSTRSLHPAKQAASTVQRSDEADQPRRWRPFLLRTLVVLSAIIATLALALTTIALLIFSRKNHGIIAVNAGEEQALFGSTDFALRLSLTWTFVPVLVFQLLILLVDAVVMAAGARQPYVELDKGAPAEKSIGLNYTSELAIKNPLTAIKLKHFTLAYSFSLMLLVNVILTALVAHLMDVTDVQTSSPRVVSQVVQFGNNTILASDSFDPVFGVVTATKLYGAQQIPWTTPDYSILPVELNNLPKTSNFELRVTSRNVQIDCRVLNAAEFQLGPTSNGWEAETSDRGCNFRTTFGEALERGQTDYLRTYTQQCSAQAGLSRIIVIAAANANQAATSLTNKTAVSCSMKYYNTTGLLSLSVDPSQPQAPVINNFIPETSVLYDPKPGFASSIEEQINQGTVIDPTGTIAATAFGQIILQYSQSLSENSYLEGSYLQQATEKLYRSLFAVFTNEYLIESGPTSQVKGTVHEFQSRLVVVPIVAYLVIVILAAMEVMLIRIYIYTNSNNSILYEEPKGLLGAATILRNSYLMDRVEEFGAVSSDGKVATTLSSIDSSDETWVYTDWQTPSNARLMNSKVIGIAA